MTMAKRSTERSAACATCGKTFARSDTLLRHQKSHHATEDRGPVHRVTNGTFRACCACAQARSRCSGGVPCGRCKVRNIECTYPNKRRKGTNQEEEGQMSFNVTELLADSPVEPSKSQSQYPGQFQQFVFSPTSSSVYAGSGEPGLTRVDSAPDAPEMESMHLQSQHSRGRRSELVTSLSASNPDGQPASGVKAGMQNMTSNPQTVPSSDHYNSTPAPMDYHATFDTQEPVYGDNSMYDESLNLNWIPLSIYPSPYGDMEPDFSFLIPTLSDTASIHNGFDSLAFDNSLASKPTGRDVDPVYTPSIGQPPASMAGFMQSPASTGSDHLAVSGYSFDNMDPSDSRKKRRKSSHNSNGSFRPREARSDFSFPDTPMITSISQRIMCSQENHAMILKMFQQTCIRPSRWKPFSTSEFPSLASLNACIDLYFTHLNSSFPLIHESSFERDADWLICLATAAIGSAFASVPDRPDVCDAFQEFLRRAVLDVTDDHDGEFRNVQLAQARILGLIGLSQSDREELRSRAPRIHADIARWCLESSILQLTAPDEEVNGDADIDAAWKRWIQQESLRRVGYFIWYLDCALGYLGNARPLCNMDDARAPLPCAEVLWKAPSAREWLVQRNHVARTPSLCAALENMYNNRKLDPSLSEIAQVLLIHALYSRTWQVGTHIKQPLSEWKSTGDAKGFLNTPSKDNFWLPLYPLYANWRNSACDCLDILHWQALAVMAKNSGAEHHGVLHLHLARVILLTPFQEIQDLIFFLINHRVSDLSKASFYVHDGSYQPRNPAKLPQIRKITLRWLREDEHKARLALIHAGSVFWHVRRYSTSSFFEPSAIYLASIVLWTYGSYKSSAFDRDAPAGTNPPTKPHQASTDDHPGPSQGQAANAVMNIQPTRVERAAQKYLDLKSRSSRSRSAQASTTSNSPANLRSHTAALAPSSIPTSSPAQPPNNNSDSDSSDDDEDDQPAFIHLDRPCDDEIVQHFVRNGHNMSGYMSNVGDICKTPQKVLLEGAKILRSRLSCWGVSREYHDILVKLAGLRKEK